MVGAFRAVQAPEADPHLGKSGLCRGIVQALLVTVAEEEGEGEGGEGPPPAGGGIIITRTELNSLHLSGYIANPHLRRKLLKSSLPRTGSLVARYV